MGTLHEVYQLQPKVITSGAILPVKKHARAVFLEQHPKKHIIDQPKTHDMWGIFANIFAIDTPDGKVQRVALYAENRIIDCHHAGIYLAIQCGSKYGFDDDFTKTLHTLAPLLEDALFYVVWDYLITRYDIKNGVLKTHQSDNFSAWNYDFTEYVKATYAQHPQMLANFYMDEIIEFQLLHDDLAKHGDDAYDYFDAEDYEEQLAKILLIKKHLGSEKAIGLDKWLTDRLNNMHKDDENC